MRMMLIPGLLISVVALHSQPDSEWVVKKFTLHYDSTVFEIDSGRTVNGVKQGAWEKYRYYTNSQPRQLMSRIVYENDKSTWQTYCSHATNGTFSCQQDSLDTNGIPVMSNHFIDNKLIRKQFIVQDSKTYTICYYPNGTVSSKGYEKFIVLKKKGRCNTDLYTSRKTGRWKYYKTNGKRKYFHFSHKK